MAETTSTVEIRHLEYNLMFPLWEQMRHTYMGEHAVKHAGEKYLPKTEGMRLDTNNGGERYKAYKLRAIYFNYLSDTINAMLGVMYAKPPEKIEIPSRIEGMKEKCNPDDEPLEALMRRVNEHQLTDGRYGLLLDVPTGEGAGVNPLIIEYPAVKILNWYVNSKGANKRLLFVVLDESGAEYDLAAKKWEKKEKYRVCGLDPSGVYYSVSLAKDEFDKFNFLNPILISDNYPKLAGKVLDFIPFTFVNVTNITPPVEKPPLLPLSNISLAIYRGEADYRQSLFMQGQDTLFVKGIDDNQKILVGAGTSITTSNTDADAKFVGVSGQGLPEMRQSQDTLHERAINMGIALIDQSNAESGEALKTRVSIKTASMKTIAVTGAQALKEQFQFAATWTNSDEKAIEVIPNLDFNQSSVTAAEVLSLWNAKIQGAPLSARSYHTWLRKNDFTDKEYEEEIEEIEEEGGTFNNKEEEGEDNPPTSSLTMPK